MSVHDGGVPTGRARGARAEAGRGPRSHAGVRGALLAVLVVLVLLLIGVVWVLPDFVGEVVPEKKDVTRAQPETVAPAPSQTALARDKRAAEGALEDFLHRQAVLESEQVATWGGDDYERALTVLAEGDAAFGNANFDYAAGRYAAATAMLDEIKASKPERLRQALAAGRAALEGYDPETAKHQYRIALALDPGNEEAAEGAGRADTLAQVKALLDRGRQFEQDRDWTAARREYEDAARLDPLDAAAREGLARAVDELEAARFRRLMSESLTAIERADFDAARRALSEARGLEPDSTDLKDAERRLRLAEQRHGIAEHRRRAEQLMQAERWHEAVPELEAVLAVDAQAQFATQGLAHSRRLAQMHDQLDRYLRYPERLYSEEPRANARKLLDAAASLQQVGPRLARKLEQLEAALKEAETPVEVVLRSDGLTDVSINRVGKLGSFVESTVTLMPGTYVVRGTREGYRDVRLELAVAPGASAPTLVVRCEERI